MYTPHIYTLRATDKRCTSTSNIPADRIPFHLSVIRCATGKLKKRQSIETCKPPRASKEKKKPFQHMTDEYHSAMLQQRKQWQS